MKNLFLTKLLQKDGHINNMEEQRMLHILISLDMIYVSILIYENRWLCLRVRLLINDFIKLLIISSTIPITGHSVVKGNVNGRNPHQMIQEAI